MAAFNVRTLKQAGQQAALALTLDSLGVDVCCVSETRIQDSSVITELTAPSVSSRFWLRTSGDPEAAATGSAEVGIVLSSRAEGCLLDWIPVNSRLCAVPLTTSVEVSHGCEVPRCLLSCLLMPPQAVALMLRRIVFTTHWVRCYGGQKAQISLWLSVT